MAFGRLILIALLVAASWSGTVPPVAASGPESRVITPRIQLRRVPSLFFSYGPGRTNCGGGVKPIFVRVSRSEVGDLRVGFFESQFFGLQPSWRAAGWMAVVVSALNTAQPMTNWRIAFDAAGRINGPSAGSLMTVAVLSALRNEKLKAGVTMTGTINPDGSIGPVSGIYYKLMGAKRAGLKTVLIPAGVTRQKICDGRMADLIAHGRAMGLTVIPVADVEEAYAVFTGRRMARPKDSGQKFRLPARARKAVIAAVAGWRKTYDTWMGRLKAARARLAPRVSPPVARLWQAAVARRAEADQAVRAGNFPAALTMMWSATVLADLGAHMARLEKAGRERGLAGMSAVFRSFLLPKTFFAQLAARLQARPIKNLNDLITMADAYLAFNAARGLAWTARLMAGKLPGAANRNFALRLIVDGAKYLVLARSLAALAGDYLAIGLGAPGPALPPPARVKAWSRMMYRAAQANLGYVERAIFEPYAKRRGRSLQRVRGWWLDRDLNYLVAVRCFDSVKRDARRPRGGLHHTASVLGGAVGSWALSALVTAKHDSLWVKVNRAGRILRLGNPDGLKRLLVSARGRARAGLIRAKKAGFTPVMPVFHLRIAEYSARSTAALGDRLSALSKFWLASIWGRMFAALGP
jgi:hypothetical protein